ncbi:MAG: FHA domain-containing protein [Elainella sp. C42_A2020_010]|nr:FHA domain-containing protein [Elainella sp. C42_A2020_010]
MSNQISTQWQAGDILLKRYKIVAILGQDELGEIYKATHLTWKTDLIIRSFKPDLITSMGGVEALQTDVAAWINLGLHPHILSCYYLRQIDGLLLLFTEYSSGSNLRTWIRNRDLYRGGTSLRRILDIAIQLAWGLDFAHQQGVVHHNVSPDTVYLTPKTVAKLGDFGLTNAHRAAGGGLHPALSDVEGWGLTVLEMFLGERVESGSAAEVLATYLKTGSPDRASGTDSFPQIPALPEPLLDLLQTCLTTPTTVDMQQVAQRLQTIYQLLTASTYPRQASPASSLADRLNNQALCQLDLDAPEAAAALWERAVSLQPDHAASTYNRGLLNWRLGAIDDWALLRQLESCRTIGASTEAPIVDYLIGVVQLERGDYQAALASLDAAQGLPDDLTSELEAVRSFALTQPPSRQWLRQLNDRNSPNRNSPDRSNPTPSSQPSQAIALSADGRYALSGGADGQVKLWQVETGQCLYVFRGHQAEVTALAFSPDGSYVVSGSADNTLKLWNLTSTSLVHTFDGLRLRRLTYQSPVDKLLERLSVSTKKLIGSNASRASGHQAPVLAVDFSADRQYLLSGGADKTVKLWDVETGRCLQTFRGHKQPVFAVQFSPDRRHCLSVSEDQTVRMWDLATGETVQTLQGFHDLTAAVFSPDGEQILTAGSVVRLWDAESGDVAKTLAGHSARVTSVAFLDANWVLTGGEDRLLRLWEIETGRCLRTFERHGLGVQALRVSSDLSDFQSGVKAGSHYALSADATSLNLWAVSRDASPVAPLYLVRSRSLETLSTQEHQTRQALMQAQAAVQQGQYATAAQQLRQVRSQSGHVPPEADQAWFDLYLYLPRQTLNQVWEQPSLQRHTSRIYSVAVQTNGRALTGSADQTVKLWDLTTGRCLLSFEGHRGAVYAVQFHPDGTYAVSASADGCLKIWHIQSGECVWTLEGHTDAVNAVAFSPDGRFLLSGSADRTCKLWDTAAGYCLRTFDAQPASITAVAFSPDGRAVLTGSADRTLKLWDMAGHTLQTLTGHSASISAVAFSADGRHLLSGSADNTLKLWNRNGNCLRTLTGHQAAVRAVAISGDGNYAVSGSDDKTLKLWNLNSGECLRTLTGHPDVVRAVAWSPEGRYLLSGSDDHSSKLWILDWELTDQSATAWDEAAKPYLETFLALQTAVTPANSDDPKAVLAALKPNPTWTETDFSRLLRTLRQAGYGWLQVEGVRQQLMRMAQAATAQPVLKQPDSTVFATAFKEFTTVFGDSPTARITLTVTSGSLTGEEFVFQEPTTCIIGRAKDCQLQLPNDEQHNTVSRYHCALEINPPMIRIRDLGSLHGTYVNGQMIGRRAINPSQNQPQPSPESLPDYALADGDEIRLGKVGLRVTIVGAELDPNQTSFDETGLIDQTIFPANPAANTTDNHS